MVKRGLAKAMMRVRFPLFARIPVLASLNDISLGGDSYRPSVTVARRSPKPQDWVQFLGSVR